MFTKNFTLERFSASLSANQPPGVSVSETSTPLGYSKQLMSQKINGLLQTTPLTITRCIVPFKNRRS